MKITVDHVLDALRKEPLLGYGGFYKTEAEAQAAHGSLIRALDEVQLCVDWLQAQDIAKRVSDMSPSSYSLKHAVEYAVGVYVSNGTLLTACCILGVPYQRYSATSPNAGCAVKRSRRNRQLHGARYQARPNYAEYRPIGSE